MADELGGLVDGIVVEARHGGDHGRDGSGPEAGRDGGVAATREVALPGRPATAVRPRWASSVRGGLREAPVA